MKLGDVLTLKRGYDLPTRRRVEGTVPIVSSSGITGSHNEAKISGPGVVTGRYGTIGEVFFVEGDFWPLNTALYVKDFKGHDRRFISYFLRHVLKGTQSDKAAVPGVNRNDLHAREVAVPPFEAHVGIASILSTYDDLIENNRRRIQLLERAARLLYKEWFVHLRFPGHEHAKVIDGVPEGWVSAPLSDICTDIRESINPRDVDPETAYIGLEHLPRRSITLDGWGYAAQVESNKFRFDEGDVLFGKIRPYFHKVGLTLVGGITSSDAIVIRPTRPSLRWYSLFLLSSDMFVSLASKTVREGSKMPRADWKYLQKCRFAVPPESILLSFDESTKPLVEQLRNLAFQNHRLVSARDLLLPRLMNGEIAV